MERRRLLRDAGVALAAGLAGCSGEDSEDGGDDRTAPTSTGTPRSQQPGTTSPTDTEIPTDHPTPTDRETVERPLDWSPEVAAEVASVTVAGTSPATAAPVRYEVRIESRTAGRPPVLRTRIENTADQALELGEGGLARHDGVRSVDEEVFLLASEMARSTEGDCWGVERPLARDTAYEVIDLGPGETVTARSYVLGTDRGTGDCLPLGRHRFEPRVFWSEPRNLPSADDGTRVDWEFTLRVARRG
jgi:hypothetical protein